MSEYWKSTPSYWCKFCSQYVRDTAIERKNHEASARHQNNIQRSLRQLHNTKAKEDRDKERAKSEVARLNGLVGGKTSTPVEEKGILGAKDISKATAPPKLSTAAQRKAHAEQLAALGVELPDELKKEITGVGGWQTVSERVIQDDRPAERSLADIVKTENDSKDGVKLEMPLNRGVHKRKADDDDEEAAAEAASRRKAWGSRLKTYPGSNEVNADEGDLETLLSGVTKKTEVKNDDVESKVKVEAPIEGEEGLPSIISDHDDATEAVKQEGEEQLHFEEIPAPVVFKKRKSKR